MVKIMQVNSYIPVEQKFLKGKLLFLYLALISAFAPISTDVYLPSMHSISEYFNASTNAVNLTLSMFFVFYSLGMLFWGPLSDKYGRKPVLLAGMIIYTLASLICVFASSIEQLIIGRIFQGLGGSASVVIVSAIIKDTYNAKERESALATVQSIAVLAPMISPLLGAAIVKIFDDWQVVFIFLFIAGIVSLLCTIFFTETHGGNKNFTLKSSFWDLKTAVCKFNLASLLLIFSLPLIPFLSYIVTASTVYMQIFKLDATQFSMFFAANAACSIISPFLYIKVLRHHFQVKNLVVGCFSLMVLAGVCMYFFGARSPMTFLLCLIPATLGGSILRPPAANMTLSQHDNAGTTSSLMGFFAMFLGGMGTLLVSFAGSDIIGFLGLMFAIIGCIALASWLYVYEKILD